jgi:hypothetical protein
VLGAAERLSTSPIEEKLSGAAKVFDAVSAAAPDVRMIIRIPISSTTETSM